MEKELNIAAILKDKPVGLKFYSPTFGCVTFNGVHKDKVYFFSKDTNAHSVKQNGKMFDDGECIIFPSKEMRDWEKFAWKKGDVLISNDSDEHIIFKGFSKSDYTKFEGKHWISVSKKRYVSCLKIQNVQDYHIEDNKESAQTYINTIEKRLGGKLSHETLEIEKAQTEFKKGDIAFADYGHKQAVFIVSGKTDLSEGYNSFIALDLRGLALDMGCMIFFKKDLCELRLATEEEKKQLFDALAKEGKAWDSEKKQIVDLPKKCEFKVFEKVLVRESKTDEWTPNFFFKIHRDDERYVMVCGDMYNYCIPYNDSTKHLLGTTDEWKGGEG